MSKDLLLNPHTYDPAHFDPETRRLLRATVDWFETRGKKALISSYIDRVLVCGLPGVRRQGGPVRHFPHAGRRCRR